MVDVFFINTGEFYPYDSSVFVVIFSVYTFGQSPQNPYFWYLYLWSKSPKSVFLEFLPLVKVPKIRIFGIYTFGQSPQNQYFLHLSPL